MTSLRIIERQIFAQRAREAEKVKSTPVAESLAESLAAAIDQAVKAALADHAALQRAQPLRPVHSPAPDLERRLATLEARATAPPKLAAVQIERDGTGLARAINVNGRRLLIQRDATGLMSRWVPADSNAPVTYNGRPVKPAAINRR